MTELQEKRWKCDWCGNVSPVLELKPETERIEGILHHYTPTGWCILPPDQFFKGLYHFCCTAHRDDFLADRQRSGEAELME